MLGALPTARERHLAGSAHSMTAMVEAEGMTRRASAALTGPGDAPARRELVGFWRGFSRYILRTDKSAPPTPGELHFVCVYPVHRIFTINGKVPDFINPDCTKSNLRGGG